MTDMSTAPRRRSINRGQILVGGRWRDSADGATSDTTDPTTEAVITSVAKCTVEDARDAVDAASAAFEDGPWGRMHHEERAKILFRMADLLDERAEDFAIREAMDMGMPYKDFRETIMPHCSGLFRFFGGLAMTAMSGGYRSSYEPHMRILTRREPLGVVAAITPFNFPLALSCSKIAPALAAGNTIVHKPASDTPLTALALAQVALDAGIPDGVYNLITGSGGMLGDALVSNPKVEKIAFTGSTEVGRGIMKAGAGTMKHLTMELGGKSPNIVFADADIDRAVQAAFWGIFWNKGEVCVAGSRLLVERACYDEVVEKLTGMANAAVLGDARVVRAFNTVWDRTLAAEAHRPDPKVGIPYAGDDEEALRVAERLIRDAGFDPVLVGGLDEARRFDVGTPVYNSGMTGDEVRASLAQAT